MLAFLAFAVPLLLTDGLDGFAIGMAIMTAVTLAARSFYLVRLFPGFKIARHALRAMLPAVPAAAVVLGMRLFGDFERSPALAQARGLVEHLRTMTAMPDVELITLYTLVEPRDRRGVFDASDPDAGRGILDRRLVAKPAWCALLAERGRPCPD